MLRLIVIFAVLNQGLCGIFDFVEFDDPYNGLFQRPLIIRQHHGRCVSSLSGQPQEGVCLSRPECTFSGGKPTNREGCLLGTCCVYSKGCSQTTDKRISYFEYSGTLENEENSCRYIVNVENNNICQMRIDFESLNLRPATQRRVGVTGTNAGTIVEGSPYECRDEFFEVTSPKRADIPIICGNNNGQHMYVPVNASAGQRHLILQVVTNNRLTNQYSWKIKVTQLECPGTFKHQKPQRTWDDFSLLAPPGCLQYHLNPTGEIMNFGYDKGTIIGNNHYTANLNYAICFRRTPDMCGIRFTVDQFRLSGTADGTNTDCTQANDGNPGSGGNAILEDADFLLIPDGRLTEIDTIGGETTNRNQNRYCGNEIFTSAQILSPTPGPFYVKFRTDDQVVQDADGGNQDPGAEPTNQENGFFMRYEELRGNSCI